MGTGPDPKAARTPAEFVATMRQLRSWADLSYRQLERKANDTGDALPRATISGVLARQDLPREEVLIAFVRACGGDAATVNTWLDARRQLAMSLVPAAPDGAGEGAEALPAPGPGTVPATETSTSRSTGAGAEGSAGEAPGGAAPSPAPTAPGDRRSRRRHLPIALTGAFAGAGVLLFVLWPSGNTSDTTQPGDGPRTTAGPIDTRPTPTPSAPSPSPSVSSSGKASESGTEETAVPPNPQSTSQASPTPAKAPAPAGMPKAGWVRMHPASSSSLCITEGRERNGRTDREIAVQRPCAEAPLPRVYLESIGNQVYRIQWHHPDPAKGKGCLGVDESLTAEGSQLLSPGDCTDALALRYRLEPSGSGYRLRPMDSGMCIGILPPRSDGAEAIQAQCTGADDQSFRFSAA